MSSVAFVPSRTSIRCRITEMMSSLRIVFALAGASMPSFSLIMKRPTRPRSYRRGSMNMPRNRARADSTVGGSPGRRRR